MSWCGQIFAVGNHSWMTTEQLPATDVGGLWRDEGALLHLAHPIFRELRLCREEQPST